MNPFDLRGPQFLLFYALLSIVTIAIAARLRRRRELEAAGEVARLHDPYAIAYLRGDKSELIRVAVVSLVDRGLLSAGESAIITTEIGRETQPRKRIERELLKYCATLRNASDLFSASDFDGAAAEYAAELEQRKLLPDAEIRSLRRPVFAGALAVLLFFSITKILVAFSRGRSNVGFLVGLTLLALVFLWGAAYPRITARGKQYLADLKNVFESLKLRAATLRPGGADADLVLATAVFGTSVLPSREYAWVNTLFPKAQTSGSSSSCGSSSGSSCGSSSCGGGGCGGGCGGCGG